MLLLAPVTRALYGLYNWRLLNQIRQRKLPGHVAIILDGHRRFARIQKLESVSNGHQLGAENLDNLLDWCDELAIPIVTVWALSLDNLNRDPEELTQLLTVIQRKLIDLAQTQSRFNSPRSIRVIGRLDALPGSVQDVITDVQARTEHLGPLRLNIAVGYDGREEITQAIRRYLLHRADEEVSLRDAANELNSHDIAQWLYSEGDPDPDLIIRTSGELRLGGFMLWQSVYSELYFCDTLWPGFRKVDFLRSLRSYQQRERRYGR